MKKFLFVLLTAALLSSFAFAELTGVGAPTVSGSVTNTFGYNLNDNATGFWNKGSFTLTLPLLDGSAKKGGSDKYYGQITVDGIGWTLRNDGFYDIDEDTASKLDTTPLDATLSAKLVLDQFFINLGNTKPSFAMNNVDIPGYYLTDANLFKKSGSADEYTHGLSLGYAQDLFSLEFKVASKQQGWKDKADDGDETKTYTGFFNNTYNDGAGGALVTNADNEYAFGIAASVNPIEGVKIPVSFFYDAKYHALGSDVAVMGVGANPTFAFAPLSIAVPVDYVTAGDDNGFEIGPKVTYDLIAGGTNVALQFIYGMYDVGVVSDSLGHLVFTFEETEANGFVDNLYAKAEFTMTDLMDDLGWGLGVKLSYNAGGLKPYANVDYNDAGDFGLGVGVQLLEAFTGLDNTVVTVDYSSRDLVNAKDKGRIYVGAKVSF